MVIMVVDGQGGGIGKALIERLKNAVGAEHELIAVGTNAMATMGMMKGGAKNIATGENAVIYNAKRADIIVGSIGIISANAMLGELSPAMAAAIGESDAVKILIPLNRCGLRVAGVATDSLPAMMDDAVRMVVDYINKNSEN
ncbi:DUF3842 family protein [Anaerotignum sp. MSJ-24]|uniref:DUF3842 family protein n=1 Tax=Anaerotignum sp. MSJ-24 TaxID=2841521 RepID=UPI001C118B29|nr:DUF3842 family protein [Anaerotignum sp. MSJ-24]MBU5464431.1 DUF3842 family protein [Anaerotignum sp. MSJ-24]